MAAAIRFVLALGFAGLLASGTLAFGAERTPTTLHRKPAAPPPPATLLVPDVRGKAYIFAKGMLEDDGFAWRVEGSVRGFAANSVFGQSPAPGTKVVDTGAPTVLLQLSKAKGYEQLGEPETKSPYPGTEIKLKRTPGDRR
jgi:beta-lactam-binding protein with PASTA domain